jgi:SAM-dependent methyltransferase
MKDPSRAALDAVRQRFSNKVAEYAASRPDYPAALIDDLSQLKPAQIADVGAGTGILTRMLLDRGLSVIAVEPNAAMQAAADAALKKYPLYQSVAGSAEATTLEDASVDLITAAQAFHWFDIEAARAECLRILKPHGEVALIWNDRVLTDPLQADLEQVFSDFGGEKRRTVLAHEDRSSVPKFFRSGSMRTQTCPHEHRLDQSGLVSLALSRSYMPTRDTPEATRVTKVVSELFQRRQTMGFVTVRYQTVVSLGRPA